MKHAKTLLFLGLVLIVLPFTGLPLAGKRWMGIAIGVIIVVIALMEQIASTVHDRGSSFKRISVEKDSEVSSGEDDRAIDKENGQ